MKIVELDGSKMDSIQNTHIHLKESMELPEYYGENLDAMYDLMTGKQEKVEETIETILITPENVDEYIEKYIEIGIITQEEYDAVK